MTATAAPPPASAHPAARAVVPVLAVLAALPWISSGVALVAGIAVALTLGNPWPARTRALAHRMLAWSVIGLGAGMNLVVVFRVGLHGFGYTALGIACAFLVGTLLGKRLGVAEDTSLLVTVGTSICGGSAIAAVAQAIRARDHDVSMALAAVFLLNSIALLTFPAAGHALGLSQEAFGLWSALAIHDTSSVVGAASQYGAQALEVATATKLARALWIVPVTIVVAMERSRRRGAADASRGKAKRPWFIAGFVLMAALVTYVPALHPAGPVVAAVAQRLLVVTLFLIGLGLSREALRSLGVRPLLQAVALWITLGGLTLAAILRGWIS